ncbi:uncharacterized protein LACBIDRAFT_327630 [Laccaria bicolor S238N-H82]|uniref:Predicted protein n=1 Tax=Laccaria bicolor (strain S238N-H82 / ATCC MYA-4686) TaxID=486041 RepID=B0DCB7_LACBS|nr:uncharacterized protein LACBIDRAFT_327628 [Laccaria bicolor S238N-H82]XP_001881491.1 uncharacterized protein LACBIDRAFT_327630 [Laccaria bicolor S238N-H82]EDR07701.1 predicted protein [Laccaria bicolor S238N-H82]EDR07702.1 predicted protein [Laccaria bicolor S238N-H82]|eukprot:XP_001881490.1 predicted protein [Laccaria bicolor S238N-H82]
MPHGNEWHWKSSVNGHDCTAKTLGANVTIVDTPGFDDNRPHMSDSKLLEDTTKFLLKRLNTNSLQGLIYLHRNSDVRFGGTAYVFPPELQAYGEQDVLLALPVRRQRDWLMMAQVPYLLSFEMLDDQAILHYATMTCNASSTPEIIRDAAKTLKEDLEAFQYTVSRYSQELDDQKTPYLVLDPSKTAISILI